MFQKCSLLVVVKNNPFFVDIIPCRSLKSDTFLIISLTYFKHEKIN